MSGSASIPPFFHQPSGGEKGEKRACGAFFAIWIFLTFNWSDAGKERGERERGEHPSGVVERTGTQMFNLNVSGLRAPSVPFLKTTNMSLSHFSTDLNSQDAPVITEIINWNSGKRNSEHEMFYSLAFLKMCFLKYFLFELVRGPGVIGFMALLFLLFLFALKGHLRICVKV